MVVFYVFLAIIGLFYGGVTLKSKRKIKLCIICASVSMTWIGLLVAREFGWFDNHLLLALLLGQSVVGAYYLFDRTVDEDLLVFRLPLLLLLSLVAYAIAAKELLILPLLLVSTVSAIHLGLYTYRKNPKVKSKIDHLVACCSRW